MICVSVGLRRRLIDLDAVHAERPFEDSRFSPALKLDASSTVERNCRSERIGTTLVGDAGSERNVAHTTTPIPAIVGDWRWEYVPGRDR